MANAEEAKLLGELTERGEQDKNRATFMSRIGWSLIGVSLASLVFTSGFQIAEGFDDRHTRHLVRTGSVFFSCLVLGLVWSFVWNPPGLDVEKKQEGDVNAAAKDVKTKGRGRQRRRV